MKHKKESFEWNGETIREESMWTWVCICGAEESAGTKAEAQYEWMCHKKSKESK